MTATTPAGIGFDDVAGLMSALPAVEWDDLETAAETTREIAHLIGDDPALLRALVERAAGVPELREKCEVHTLDDKIVIWDDPDRGLRIRLRLSNTTQYERVHNHRFSFTAYLLSGTYHHVLYATDQPLDDTADVTRFHPRSVREERTGDVITLHHQQLHTTLTDPDTVSLMIQSPAQKRRAFMIRRSDGEVWYRVGAADEDQARRREVRMSDERLDHWRRRLSELGIC